MELVVDKLTEFSSSTDEELRDISGLGTQLRLLRSDFLMTRIDSSQDDHRRASNRRHDCRKGMRQADSQAVGTACDCKLVIWFPSREPDSVCMQPGIPPDTLIETLSILSILVTHFPTYVSSLSLAPPPIQTITPLLTHARPAVRKRAIVTLSQFVPLSAPELSAHLLSAVINPNLQLSAPLEKQRTTVNLVAAIARTSPQRLASGLGTIVSGILRVVDLDDEELREGALQVKFSLYSTCLCVDPFKALESIVLRIPSEVSSFLGTIIQVGTKYIKFDPVS